MKRHSSVTASGGLKPYLTTWGAVALSFGCAVGWGAFIMPGTTFLPVAGPLGSLIGLGVGAMVMFLVGRNYHYLMQKFPEAGGAYGYVKRVCGGDAVLTDMWMPELDGEGLAKAIRADASLAQLPVHVITADVELQENYSEKGFDSIVLKPVTVGTLGPLLVGLAERKN